MKKVSSQAVWQTFLTNLTIQVCNLITGVLTARILLPEGRGELAAIILSIRPQVWIKNSSLIRNEMFQPRLNQYFTN